MKTLKMFFLTTTILLISVVASVSIWGDHIPTTGEWTGPPGGLRSSIPAPPEADIEGNTVSIYFPSALTNVTVYIMDANGVVYQTTISSNGSDYTCPLPWVGQPGNYQILLVHGYGQLGGGFTIE